MSSTSMLRGSDAALKRLHVSGLSASHCSAEDIRHRFTSFGVEVVNIYNWPPRQDAVGNQTDWCFVSVKGNEPNISRATSILNGTMWKGSKLRVGIAKPQRFNDASSADSSNENGTDPANDEKKQKKQREKTNRSRLRRGIAGVEGEDVAKPVQVEDVDRGLWGWKKSHAGHLIRPMQMRPSRPLPPPVHPGSNGIRSLTSIKPTKPPSRSRCVTIDPSRYGGLHLNASMLDEGVDTVHDAMFWHCEEELTGNGKNLLWFCEDASGNLKMTEKVRLPSAETNEIVSLNLPEGASSESSQSVSEGSEESFELPSVMDEIDLAIDQAASEVSEDEVPALKKSLLDEMEANRDLHFSLECLPEEEDNFSDGYQEGAHEGEDAQPADSSSEKRKQLAILKQLFSSSSTETDEMFNKSFGDTNNEKEEAGISEDMSTNTTPKDTQTTNYSAAALRASLLKNASDKQEETSSGRFEAVTRFDPSVSGDKGSVSPVQKQDMKKTQAPSEQFHEDLHPRDASPAPIREEGYVKMTSLKDMFRPMKEKSGFSLLEELDLDLDDEFDFANENLDDSAEQHTNTFYGNDRAQKVKLPSSQAGGLFLFPQLDISGNLLSTDQSIFSQIRKKTKEMEANRKRKPCDNFMLGSPLFLEADDEDTLERRWQTRKSDLTQAYKRRHREALKKKRRRFTGSRAAGTALPGRV